MHLGMEKNSGACFEGSNHPELPILPKPVLSQCHLIEKESDWGKLPTGMFSNSTSWMFREDSYDPVSRMRRGRVYQPYGIHQPSAVMVPRNPSPDTLGQATHPSSHRNLDMYRYYACTQLLSHPNHGQGMTLAVGSSSAHSAWRIVQVESLANGDILATLRAKTAFGVIPELDEEKLPKAARKLVKQAIERAVNAAFRESAVSVVDQCRNALAVILSHYLHSIGEEEKVLKKELAPLAKMLVDTDKAVCGNAAFIVARMHSRGKGNEQFDKGLREPVDEDGELAVHTLGLVMREIGWAQ